MHEGDVQFTGSIPENYDRAMVPLIFAPYAADMARRVSAMAPEAVLEVAAGTGVVTRALAPLLSPSARYTVTDLNPAMLEHAAVRQGADARITWRQADAMALPFEDHAFEVVCCQFGAMFFPDRPAAFSEVRRVLKPGGLFVFSVWDRIEENHLANTVTEALAAMFPDDPPRFLARTPHGYHDTGLIRADCAAAGLRDIRIETLAETSPAPSARLPAVAYCQGTVLRSEITARGENLLEPATAHVETAIARRHGAGPIAAKIQAHVVSATA